jgi:hypothetical protein
MLSQLSIVCKQRQSMPEITEALQVGTHQRLLHGASMVKGDFKTTDNL